MLEKPTGYDPRLSGLRGSASFMIVLYHVAGFSVSLTFPPLIASFYNQSITGFWVAVPVFLMLSMVLLLRSLDSKSDIRHYFWRRIKRIWPIYFGSLAIIFLFFSAYAPWHLTMWDYVGFFTFTEYYFHPFVSGPLVVFWTLQLEEIAYVFIPLIHASRHKGWIGSILVGVGLSWTFLLFSTNLITSTWASRSILWFTPPGWMLAYGLGILIYTGVFKGQRWKAMRWLVPPMLVIGSFGLPFNLPNFVQEYELFYPLVCLGFAAVVAHPPSFLKYCAVIGEGSYAMYATHTMFLLVFGILGLPLVLLSSFCVEFAMRPSEILRRLNLPPVRVELVWKLRRGHEFRQSLRMPTLSRSSLTGLRFFHNPKHPGD